MEREKGSCSYLQTHSSKTWRTIWNVQGTKALQMFLWKACQNILPTKVNLHWRNCAPDPLCPICEIHEESVGHILWHYQSA